MVKFGLVEKWEPVPGRLISWAPTSASRAAAASAPAHPTPPSHIQEAYLESAHRNRDSGFRFSRLCLITFDIAGRLDVAAMTSAVNSFVTRHDTFLTWFTTDDQGCQRHLVDASDVELAPTDHGVFTDSEQIRDHVQTATPGPDVWECFTFGVVEQPERFTVYAAIDHLATDGISQALTIYELRELYTCALNGEGAELAEAGSYIEYCARERAASARLDLDSPTVRSWIEIVQANGGDLPTFPLDLGMGEAGYTRTADTAYPLLDPARASRFDEACERVGAKFSGGIFAAAALAQYELTGRPVYLGLTPKSTRSTPGEWAAIGWFASLIPIQFSVTGASSFLQLAAVAQQAFVAGKELGDTSYHRVLELVTAEHAITTKPGWTAPMISYVDVRKLPGEEELAAARVGLVGLFGSRGSSEDVFMWINRFTDHTGAVFLYPDTEQAARSIDVYFAKINEIFQTVVDEGDYRPTIPDAAGVDPLSGSGLDRFEPAARR
ncbi:condensation domain-containing protein [Jatrophihabitans sp. GAS493]|uniref:condensation domain-containing protein n=1 Tax=Jatrophihabitans sp. GAS493 TaxID=1907575 RepID=UPI000BB80957|nr:condensation domain-containing protein [Jatrophihabitans sp. GAS493]SOD73229.1 condensation domain-containing protein [Jatrophihabitans sp. GAS493]